MTYPFLISESPIQVLPALAGAVGFDEAAALQEIHYWLDPRVNENFFEDRYWVSNVFDKLQERFFFWDEYSIGYMIAQFEQSGILMVSEDIFQNIPQNSIKNSSKGKYYTINYEFLKGDDHSAFQLVPRTPFIQNMPALQKSNSNRRPSFTAEVLVRGPYLYAMVARDSANSLACELTLEIHEKGPKNDESEDEAGQGALQSRDVICHFPRIDDEKLKELVWGDVTLYGIIMVRFQMKIMGRLLLFCATHHASNLVIFADDIQADKLGIYRDFLAHKIQNIPPKGEKTEMIIPTDRETFDRWVDFMEDVTIRFRQILWEGQKENPAIQHYLKLYPLSEF